MLKRFLSFLRYLATDTETVTVTIMRVGDESEAGRMVNKAIEDYYRERKPDPFVLN